MPFGLTIGTERAAALQQAIQDELTKRGFSPDADPVMAEYITIMVINNKTPVQITSELEDLIGSDFNPSFTEWLFEEASRGVSGPDAPQRARSPAPEPSDAGPSRDPPLHISSDAAHSKAAVPRTSVVQQANSQTLPIPSSHKRTSSARSTSPQHPSKTRRTDLPTAPRAMFRDGNAVPSGNVPNSRSLLERVGGPAGNIRNNRAQGHKRDDIQARIDNIVNNSPDPSMMMAAGFPGMGGMDMNALAAANMGNPLMLQEMMVNQMALMAQMASSMGILNPVTGQFAGQGYPMQGIMPGDMGMYQQNMMNTGFQNTHMGMNGRGRGGMRGRTVGGRSRGNAKNVPEAHVVSEPTPIVAPQATPASISVAAPSAETPAAVPNTQPRIPYALPERPVSPTLCKFSTKCTNSQCRFSHPSPVATAESGIVLSNDACEKGKECKDKDCVKGHVSPAALNQQATEQQPPAPTTVPHSQISHNPVPCRFGSGCTRPNCAFSHPPRPNPATSQQPCRYGAGCTRATCTYQHPPGRVLPTTFHRGLSASSPIVTVVPPGPGSMSYNKSVTFNIAGSATAKKKQQGEEEEKLPKAVADKGDSSVALTA